MTVKSELLEVLACPKCKQGVEIAPDSEFIVCLACKLRYPIRDDIPIMLLDEAKTVES